MICINAWNKKKKRCAYFNLSPLLSFLAQSLQHMWTVPGPARPKIPWWLRKACRRMPPDQWANLLWIQIRRLGDVDMSRSASLELDLSPPCAFHKLSRNPGMSSLRPLSLSTQFFLGLGSSIKMKFWNVDFTSDGMLAGPLTCNITTALRIAVASNWLALTIKHKLIVG